MIIAIDIIVIEETGVVANRRQIVAGDHNIHHRHNGAEVVAEAVATTEIADGMEPAAAEVS